MRPPPSSTLFPYTTLFRSQQLQALENHLQTTRQTRRVRIWGLGAAHLCRVVEILQRHVGQDRKSTRLNSSHPSITYAVFCLKKKKTAKTTKWSRVYSTTAC